MALAYKGDRLKRNEAARKEHARLRKNCPFARNVC